MGRNVFYFLSIFGGVSVLFALQVLAKRLDSVGQVDQAAAFRRLAVLLIVSMVGATARLDEAPRPQPCGLICQK